MANFNIQDLSGLSFLRESRSPAAIEEYEAFLGRFHASQEKGGDLVTILNRCRQEGDSLEGMAIHLRNALSWSDSTEGFEFLNFQKGAREFQLMVLFNSLAQTPSSRLASQCLLAVLKDKFSDYADFDDGCCSNSSGLGIASISSILALSDTSKVYTLEELSILLECCEAIPAPILNSRLVNSMLSKAVKLLRRDKSSASSEFSIARLRALWLRDGGSPQYFDRATLSQLMIFWAQNSITYSYSLLEDYYNSLGEEDRRAFEHTFIEVLFSFQQAGCSVENVYKQSLEIFDTDVEGGFCSFRVFEYLCGKLNESEDYNAAEWFEIRRHNFFRIVKGDLQELEAEDLNDLFDTLFEQEDVEMAGAYAIGFMCAEVFGISGLAVSIFLKRVFAEERYALQLRDSKWLTFLPLSIAAFKYNPGFIFEFIK